MWTRVMIVLGADTHKRSHTLAAINVATGRVLGDKTVQVGPRGFATLLGRLTVLWIVSICTIPPSMPTPLEQVHEVVVVGLERPQDSHTSNMWSSSSP
jgi:hypothetical protein